MRRLVLLPFSVLLVACPGDKKPQRTAAAIPIDTTQPPVDTTTQTDLSKIKASTPPAAPDTYRLRKLTPSGTNTGGGAGGSGEVGLPEAPQALLYVVERETSAEQFCFTEFGKKSDPGLRGNVIMAVSVNGSGVSDAHVASSAWSGAAGSAVNRCLNDRAKRAWQLAPGAVKPGRYSVRLTFSGS